MTCATQKPILAPSRQAHGIVSGGGFGSLRDRILKQRRITRTDYDDLRSAHNLMDDPAASMVWRIIKTYERHNLAVMPLHAGEIVAMAEVWPNDRDEQRAGTEKSNA